MEAMEAIRHRRSVRSYTGQGVPREVLEQIVDAGRHAATGHNRQPWDFVVVTDRRMIDQLKEATRWMESCGAIIAVVLDPSSRWWLEDGSASVQNMLVASTALGYGSCWVEGDLLGHEREFMDLLGIPENKRLLALVPVGVAERWPTKEKKSLAEVIHWERYGARQ